MWSGSLMVLSIRHAVRSVKTICWLRDLGQTLTEDSLALQAEGQDPTTEHISVQGRHFPSTLPFISDIKASGSPL